MRRALVVLGVLAIAWGARSLLLTGWHNVLATVVWMAGTLVGVPSSVSPSSVRVWPLAGCSSGPLRGQVTGGLIVLGTGTVTPIPVLGRFGAKADNPTVLDRSHLGGLGGLRGRGHPHHGRLDGPLGGVPRGLL